MKLQLLAVRKFFFFSFLFLVIILPLKAKGKGGALEIQSKYHQEVWTDREGLPGNTIYQVMQSRDAYLWLATSAGLVRFDGVRFKLCDSGIYEVLKGEEVFSLLEDQHGNLWVGTTGKVFSFKRNGCSEFSFKDIGNARIRCLGEDKAGSIWFATEGAGIYCMMRNTKEIIHYHEGNGLSNNMVRDICIDQEGTTWAATLQGLNAIVNGNIRFYGKSAGLPANETRDLAVTLDGKLWVATSKGLAMFDKSKSLFVPIPLPGNFSRKEISAILPGPGDSLWLGVVDMGVLLYRKGNFSTPIEDDDITKSILYSIFTDQEGNTWFGSVGNGLKKISPYLFTSFTSQDGLSNDDVYGIYEDSQKRLWITTYDGLNLWDKGHKRVFNKSDGLSGNSVCSICEDRHHDFWIGTLEAGLNRYVEEEKRFIHFPPGAPGSPPGNSIYALHLDASGTLWVGTEKGLHRLEENAGRFKTYTRVDGMSGDFVRYIVHDQLGSLWIGTDNGGLNCLHNGKFQVFDHKKGLSSDRVLAIHVDTENVLWVATYKGLNRLEDGSITAYSRKEGLFHDLISVMLEDDLGNLWLGGDKGIFRVAKKDLKDFAAGKLGQVKSIAYNENDGMASRVCLGGNQPSACKTDDGRLWFPTIKGVVVIEPTTLASQNPPPDVILEELIVDGQPRQGIDFSQETGEFSPLELEPGVKRVEFVYTAPSFTDPSNIRFRFRLEGYDNNWIPAGNKRSTYYTGLPPGKYRFQVTACNREGTWNTIPSSFTFRLLPYFYETSWFFISLAFIVILSGVTFYHLRTRQLKRREKELSQTVAERTEQLAAQSEKLKEMDHIKSRFFANISHEFRTPLTLIMGPLQEKMATGNTPQEREEADMMLRNSQRLLDLINQLLDLSKLESGRMQLLASEQNVVPFLRGLVGSFESLVEQKGIELSFHAEEDEIIIFFDTEKMEKIIVNLVANAIKFTAPGGQVTVTASRTQALPNGQQPPTANATPKGYLEIKTCDTGIGIPSQQLPYVFDRFYQVGDQSGYRRQGTGIGLALVKELVELHHGHISVASQEGKGSEFTVHLPIGKDHLQPGEIMETPRGEAIIPVNREAGSTSGGLLPDAGELGVETTPAAETAGKQDDHDQEKDVVLVVEDNPDVRRYIRGPLSAHYSVIEAENGKKGMEVAREIIPDLIISDVMMPEADGYELCRELKQDVKTSHIPIILLTAKASEESEIEGLERGADDYVTKPFNVKILLTRIKNLIDLRRQLQEKIQRDLVLRPDEVAVSSVDRAFMEELKRALEKNLADPDFDVDGLAAVLYMSRASLNRKLRALTGESTKRFIQSFRLKRGAQLLKDGYGNVTEVAFAVGFSSSPYFTKCFKEKFNQLPNQYREMNEKGGKV